MLAIDYEKELAINIVPYLKRPTNDKELDELITLSMELSDEINDDINHPYTPLLDVIEDHIEEYENQHIQKLSNLTTPAKMLRHLVESNNFNQSDLIPVFGNQGNVSKVLNEKGRGISVEHIPKLAKLFNVSPEIFIPN